MIKMTEKIKSKQREIERLEAEIEEIRKTRKEKASWKVPFFKGQMVSYIEGYFTMKEYSKDFELKDNYEFFATLTLKHVGRGRSSVGFSMEDYDGKSYNMFLKDFEEMVKNNTLDHGQISGKWTFVKRGQNYGIKCLGEEK